MRSAFRFTAILAALTAAGVGTVYAQASPPNTAPPAPVPLSPPPPVGKATPSLFIMPRAKTLPVYYSFDVLPYTFSFDDELIGEGFHPNEKVTVTRMSSAGKSSAAVSADSSGNFRVEERYEWAFCAANAKPSPPPNFVASGNEGSSASVSRQATPCPLLQAFGQPSITVGEPGGSGTGSSGSGSVNPGGIVLVPPATIVPPGNPAAPGPSTPSTIGVLPPQLTKISIQGFGFAPGESVSVGEQANSYFHPASTPVQVKADAQGRFSVMLPMHVPAQCSYFWFPVVVAAGNKGTSAVTRVLWHSPLMIACPVHEPPPGSNAPVVPSPTISKSSASSVFTNFAVHLQPKVVAGGSEKARISSDARGTVKFSIRYAGGRNTTRTGKITARNVLLSWKVPKATRAGTANVTTTFASAGTGSLSVSLQSRFKVTARK